MSAYYVLAIVNGESAAFSNFSLYIGCYIGHCLSISDVFDSIRLDFAAFVSNTLSAFQVAGILNVIRV